MVGGILLAMTFMGVFCLLQMKLTPRFLKYDTATAIITILFCLFFGFWIWTHFIWKPFKGSPTTQQAIDREDRR